ncbi:hypothetical protein ACQR1I_01560 [Bradyrhizobium sp. HKCCYLS2038]
MLAGLTTIALGTKREQIDPMLYGMETVLAGSRSIGKRDSSRLREFVD